MNEPGLSVVSTTYNDSHFAGFLYSSLKAKLITGEWEWVIVNDGSDADHKLRLNSFVKDKKHVGLYHIKNSGPAKARDAGIEKASAHYLVVIDIDDLAVVDSLTEGLQLIQEKELDIMVGDANVFYENGSPEKYWETGPIDFEKMIIRNQWLISNIFTKTIWNKVGGLTTNQSFPREDYLFWTKCIGAGAKVGYLNKPFIRYRRKIANSRNQTRRTYEDRLHLYRALHPHQQKAINYHFSGKKKQALSAFSDAKLGYYEYQSGKKEKGWNLLTKSIRHHPKKLNLLAVFLKTPFKRFLNEHFGKEL